MIYRTDISYVPLNQYLTDIDYYGLENISFQNKIFDFFIKYFKNLSTSILGLFSDFKRSELKVFVDSNHTAVNSYLKNKEINMFSMIYIPTGMICTYRYATDTLFKLLDKIDINDTIEVMHKFIINKEFHKIRHILEKINKVDISYLEKQLQTIFVKNSISNTILKNVVSSVEDLNYITDHLLKLDDTFKDSISHGKHIFDLEKETDKIISQLENNKKTFNLTTDDIRDLSNILRIFAIQIDAYATVIQSFQMVEHNFKLTLSKLVYD